MNAELISWPARKSALSQHEVRGARIRANWPAAKITSVEVITDCRRRFPHVVCLRARSCHGIWGFPEKTGAVHFAYGLAGWT
jgi:hypothetical protein